MKVLLYHFYSEASGRILLLSEKNKQGNFNRKILICSLWLLSFNHIENRCVNECFLKIFRLKPETNSKWQHVWPLFASFSTLYIPKRPLPYCLFSSLNVSPLLLVVYIGFWQRSKMERFVKICHIVKFLTSLNQISIKAPPYLKTICKDINFINHHAT